MDEIQAILQVEKLEDVLKPCKRVGIFCHQMRKRGERSSATSCRDDEAPKPLKRLLSVLLRLLLGGFFESSAEALGEIAGSRQCRFRDRLEGVVHALDEIGGEKFLTDLDLINHSRFCRP